MPANAYPVILYDSRFRDATPTATDTATGYNVSNINDYRTYTFHKFAASGTKYITVDCATAKADDSLAIIGHNLATAAATISVESSDNGSSWTERLAGFTVTTDKALLKTFSSVSARYWRIKFVSASVAVQIAVAMLGARFTFSRYPNGSFDPSPERLVASSSRSKSGHLLGSTLRYIETDPTLSFKAISTDWVEATFRPLWDNHLKLLRPFFVGWDITNHPLEIGYYKIPDDFSLSMPFDPYRRSLSLSLEGVKE